MILKGIEDVSFEFLGESRKDFFYSLGDFTAGKCYPLVSITYYTECEVPNDGLFLDDYGVHHTRDLISFEGAEEYSIGVKPT